MPICPNCQKNESSKAPEDKIPKGWTIWLFYQWCDECIYKYIRKQRKELEEIEEYFFQRLKNAPLPNQLKLFEDEQY